MVRIEANHNLCSDYATKVFGFKTFGQVYGAIICLSGLANLSQYGIDALVLERFRGNPTPVNIFLAAAGFIVGTVLVAFVWYQGKVVGVIQNDGFPDPERQPLVPKKNLRSERLLL